MNPLSISFALLVSSLIVAGCASSQVVPVEGKEQDLAMLAGDWEGSYDIPDNSRSGKISFNLAVGRHTAKGQILMQASDAPEVGVPTVSHSDGTPLTIEFVRTEGDKLSGKVKPYMDPQCNCESEAEFEGDIMGNVITGTFLTRKVGGETTQEGTWQATRVER